MYRSLRWNMLASPRWNCRLARASEARVHDIILLRNAATDDKPELRCIGCGYALIGLTQNRCPECGREFDPHNPLTTDSSVYRQRLSLAYWLPPVVFVAVFITMFFVPVLLPYEIEHLLQAHNRPL